MAQEITNLITNVTAPVNHVMMKGLLSAARKRLPFFNGTLPGELTKNGGSLSVQWERINNLAVVTTALSEPTGNGAFGNNRDSVVPTVSRLSVASAKYGKAITLTEEVDLIQVNVRAARFLETLGANAGESFNELMVDVWQAGLTGTARRLASGVTTITSIVQPIKTADIKFAANRINRNSGQKFSSMGNGSTNIGTSPIRDAYFGVCHPDVEEDLRGISGWVGVEQYAGYMATEVGEIGTLNGVRFCVSEIAGIGGAGIGEYGVNAGGGPTANAIRVTTAGTACDLYDTIIYGKEAMGTIGLGTEHAERIYKMYDKVPTVELIHHKKGSSGVGDMFNEIESLAWKGWFAGKILQPLWASRVITGASKLTT